MSQAGKLAADLKNAIRETIRLISVFKNLMDYKLKMQMNSKVGNKQ